MLAAHDLVDLSALTGEDVHIVDSDYHMLVEDDHIPGQEATLELAGHYHD